MMENQYEPKADRSADKFKSDQAIEPGQDRDYLETLDAASREEHGSVRMEEASAEKGFRWTVGRKLFSGFRGGKRSKDCPREEAVRLSNDLVRCGARVHFRVADAAGG